jgi:hypothetical protein
VVTLTSNLSEAGKIKIPHFPAFEPIIALLKQTTDANKVDPQSYSVTVPLPTGELLIQKARLMHLNIDLYMNIFTFLLHKYIYMKIGLLAFFCVCAVT